MTLLYAYVLVTATLGRTSDLKYREYRYMGEYSSAAACESAAKRLDFDIYRCLSKVTGK